MELRLARDDDAAALRDLYNHYVLASTDTFDLVARSLDDQRAWLAHHAGVHPAVVALDGEGVLGFGSLSPYRDRPAYATTVEDSVYVRPDAHRRGVGRALLDELLRLGTGYGFHAVIARIVGQNEASIGLHRVCGFEVVGVEHEVGRKFGRWLDVVELQRLL